MSKITRILQETVRMETAAVSAESLDLLPVIETSDAVQHALQVRAEKAERYATALEDYKKARRTKREYTMTVESLNELRACLNHFNKQGGLPQQAAPFMVAALGVHSRRFGVPRPKLRVDLQNYHDHDSRQICSMEDVDNLADQLAEQKNIVDLRVDEAHETLTERHSELAPPAPGQTVKDGCVEAALVDEELAAEVEGTSDAATNMAAVPIPDSQEVIERSDEIAQDAAVVDTLKEEIVHQNEEGGLSAEALMTAAIAFESITRYYGLPEVALIDPEQIRPAGQNLVSVEAIDALREQLSLEYRSTLSRAGGRITNLASAYSVRVPIMRARLASIVKRAQALGSRPAPKVTVRPMRSSLDQEGKVPNKPADYYISFAKLAQKLFSVTLKNSAEQQYTNWADLMRSGSASTEKEFSDQLGKLVSGFKDPRASLTENELKFPVPGRQRLFYKTPAIKYQGTLSFGQKLSDLSTGWLPAHGVYRFDPGYKDSNAAVQSLEYPALSASEIIKVATELHKALSTHHNTFFNNLPGFFEDSKLSAFSKNRKYFPTEIGLFRRALVTNATFGPELASEVYRTTLSVSSGFIKYAKLSLDAAESAAKASTESRYVSLEAKIAELKVGEAVNYKGKAGKILSIKTAPFMQGGTHYKASPGSPLYVVKTAGDGIVVTKAGDLSAVKA